MKYAWFAAIVAVLTTQPTMAIEEPIYRVLEQEGSFELREYSAYVVAETRVEAAFKNAGNIAFNRLFRYINGNNVVQQKIAMTAPVSQSRDASRSGTGGEKIAMTAPVSQQAEGKAFRVAFTLPASYTRDSAPQPTDPSIEIREVPKRLLACWRYTGRWTEGNYRDNEKILLDQVKTRGLVVRGEPILARYNPPFTPWFLRRNEVLIPVVRQPGRRS